MNPTSPLLREEPPLPVFTEEQRTAPSISWYRSPLPPGALKRLHERNDLSGGVQTLGYLAVYAAAAAATIWSSFRGPWWLTIGCFFFFGMVGSFMINAVHELGHGTVFRTKWLNVLFDKIFAFLGWINHESFEASHIRHHRYTLHPPDDLEVTLPTRFPLRQFFTLGLVNPAVLLSPIRETVRLACGRFQGEWELTLFPESALEKRQPPIRFARLILAGRVVIAAVSAWQGWWIVPLLFLPNFCGAWLFLFCNNTQHIGLQDNVSDFRLCCRTFTLNPAIRFLYWQMNYHIEHHMYAAVPCYNLGKLHRLIRDDLPPTPDGIVAVWKDILAIQKKQQVDPKYQHQALVPQKASI